MNRILFFFHEVERFCIQAQGDTYVLRLPLCDDRVVHIRTVLQYSRTKPLCLKAGIIEHSMGTLHVCEEETGALVCHYAVEARDTFASNHTITVLLAHPRPPVMARLIRDLSTMGVSDLVVYASDLSEKSYLKASLWARADTLALQGAMQATGVNTLPRLRSHYSLAQALTYVDADNANATRQMRKVYFSHEAEKVFFSTLVGTSEPSVLHWVLALGAERGLTAHEEALLLQQGFDPHVLCNTVLRCESAVNVAVGMCMGVLL